MRIAIGVLAIFGSTAFAGDGGFAKPPQQAAPAASASLSDHAKLLDPIQIDSLSLPPIITTQAAQQGPDLLVLDEAMPKQLVRIREHDDGDVNNLTLSNNADRPLFLLAGEVIIGGKQDRIIGRNTVIPAKTTLEVPVFCVEHGRWEEETKEFKTAKALAHGRLRGSASFDSQADVWNEVAAKNKVRKTESSTDTYRKVAAQQSDSAGTVGKMEQRVDAALAKLPADQRANLVGFAVSLNGKVATVDLFSSPKLFGKLEGKLVRSYLTEAEDITAHKDIKAPTAADVTSFMADAAKADSEQSYDTKAAHTTIRKGKRADAAKVMLDVAPTAGPIAAPAPAVYETYQGK